MNVDEIKSRYSMQDILDRYGLKPNRAGFISCPFHKEKTASMKIYKDSFYCFGCGAAGDIFDFVGRMENISFKEAFLQLGGTYDNSQEERYKARIKAFRARQRQRTINKLSNQIKAAQTANSEVIRGYRQLMELCEPLSDDWCNIYNKLQYQLYVYDILHGAET